MGLQCSACLSLITVIRLRRVDGAPLFSSGTLQSLGDPTKVSLIIRRQTGAVKAAAAGQTQSTAGKRVSSFVGFKAPRHSRARRYFKYHRKLGSSSSHVTHRRLTSGASAGASGYREYTADVGMTREEREEEEEVGGGIGGRRGGGGGSGGGGCWRIGGG